MSNCSEICVFERCSDLLGVGSRRALRDKPNIDAVCSLDSVTDGELLSELLQR